MKLLLACLILLASPLQAQVARNCRVIKCPSDFMPTPVQPSTSARQLVATALADVQIAEAAEIIADDELIRRSNQIKASLEKSTPWYKPWKVITEKEIQAAKLSDPDYLRRMVKHQSAVATNYRARNAAILEALKAFQLFPPVTDFTGDPRAAEFNMVAKPWFPRYSRNEKRDDETGQWRKRNDKELGAEKNINSAFGGGPAAAFTTGDGVIKLWSQAFSSPEELALNIFHETSHWIDVAAVSGGSTFSDPPAVSFRSEQHAYERAAAFAQQLSVDPTHHQRLAAQFKLQADISENEHLTRPQIKANPQRFGGWLGTDWKGQLAIAPAEPELSTADEALLQKKMTEAQRLVNEDREYRRRVEEARRQGESVQPIDLRPSIPGGTSPNDFRAVPTQPGNGAIALNPSQPPISELQLKDIAARACAAPPQPVDRQLSAVDWRLFQTTPGVERYADGLSGCEQRVVLRLIALGLGWRPGAVIGADEVRAAAAGSAGGGGSIPPDQNHGRVWDKIGPIIRR